MTPAERPTQEVAPRTACEHIAVRSQTNWIDDGKGGTKPGGMAWSCEDCQQDFGPTEASRSAPPAAVTALRESTTQLVLRFLDLVEPELGDSSLVKMAAQEVRNALAAQPSGEAPFLVPVPASVMDANEVFGLPRGSTVRIRPAKPTGSADEPLLRAALDDLRLQINVYDAMPVHEVTEESVRAAEGRIIEAARAALASAEPAEVDGDE